MMEAYSMGRRVRGETRARREGREIEEIRRVWEPGVVGGEKQKARQREGK